MAEQVPFYKDYVIEAEKTNLLQPSNDDDFNIGAYSKLLTFKKYLIALDREVTKTLFVWDTLGKPLYKIEPRPGAENEVKSIYDFCINYDEQQLLILDPTLHFIKAFNLTNGNYIKSYPLNNHYYNMEYLDKNKLILYFMPIYNSKKTIENQRYFLYDLQKESTQPLNISINASNSFISHSLNENTFIRYNNEVITTESLYDTTLIFNNTNNQLKISKIPFVKWQEKNLNNKNAGTMEDFVYNKVTLNYWVGQGTLIYNDKIFVLASESSKAFYYTFPFKGNTEKITKHNRLTVMINNEKIGLPIGYTSDDGTLLFPLPIEYANMLHLKDRKSSFSEDGNEVILIIKPKFLQ